MKRLYEQLIFQHFRENRQMLFFMGPRQVGKTTVMKAYGVDHPPTCYLNWDNADHRLIILEGPSAVAQHAQIENLQTAPLLLQFDEIHKYSHWKDFLKGFFDTYSPFCSILVTGSARLDIFQKGGDSLMGRYFPYHFYPLTIAELLRQEIREEEIAPPQQLDQESIAALWHFGGFPEPFFKRDNRFSQRWKKLRQKQLLEEDIRDLTKVEHIEKVELLAELVKHQAGQLVSIHSLAKKLRASDHSVRNWIGILRNLYFCFAIPPYATSLPRALTKEPKYYLWDWSLVADPGARLENLVAVHLRKAIHFWNDHGLGAYELFFLRDREKREVDFLVTREGKPWFLVEVKKSPNKGISPYLHYFSSHLEVQHAFQVVWDLPYVDCDCFADTRPLIVPATTFLSQLI